MAEPAAAEGRVATVPGEFAWDDIGDFRSLSDVLESAPDWDAALGAIFTLAREETVSEVRVAGDVVFSREPEPVAA